MMVTVRSLGLTGITGYEVSVECFLSGGLPGFDVVGLPDAAAGIFLFQYQLVRLLSL